jgi:hypothetical protein
MSVPETQYARNGDVWLAYQIWATVRSTSSSSRGT